MNQVNTLWKKRFVTFWREASLYWRYVGRSGFTTFLFILYTVGMYYYIRTLKVLPDSFPYLWIIIPLLLLALARSPIRTFLKEADVIFLMPAESQMDPYFRKSFIYSLILQIITVIAVSLLIWPLYIHFHEERSAYLILILLLFSLIKWANLLCSWHEGRMLYPHQRRLVCLLRWIMNAVILYLFLQHSLYISTSAILLVVILAIVIYRIPKKMQIHWEYLILTEQLHLTKHYLFFSWFTDVPQLPSIVNHRKMLTQITNTFAFHKQNTFLYLYTKTIIRSELFGILARIVLIGMLLLAAIPSDIVKILIFGSLLIIVGVQSTSLEQHHAYSFWIKLYPIDITSRVEALTRIVFSILLTVCVLFGTVFAFSAISFITACVSSIISVAFVYYFSFALYHKKLLNRLLQS